MAECEFPASARAGLFEAGPKDASAPPLSYAMTPLCGGSTTERIIMAIDSFNSREQPRHTTFARPDARARRHHDPTSLERPLDTIQFKSTIRWRSALAEQA